MEGRTRMIGFYDYTVILTYFSLLSACDIVTYVSHMYSPDCMMKRNQYMIDRSSLLIACFNGRSSGTMNTILYAERAGVNTVILEI